MTAETNATKLTDLAMFMCSLTLQMERVSICLCSRSTTGSADDSCHHGLFRCMHMLCGILRFYIPQLGDSSTAAMSLVIVEIFRAVPSPSSARSAAAQTGLLATPRAHQR